MKPSPNTTVLERLLSELQEVAEHFSLDCNSRGKWTVRAFVAEGHRSVDTRHDVDHFGDPFTVIVSDDRAGASLELAAEDVLERIALAAPQAVPA